MTRPTHAVRARDRRRNVVRGGTLLAGAILVLALGGWKRLRAGDTADVGFGRGTAARQLDDVKGEMAMTQLQLDRANRIVAYSTRYQIPADLASSIYDIALAEGIPPQMAFQLVKVESNFTRTARSAAGAIGYTQVQLATARFYEPEVDETRLMDRETNLRIGFRFLKSLMRQYDGDPALALVAYNRGPGRVNEILDAGGNPANGYAELVLKGARVVPRGSTE
jgi:soluble lytic murein transglycosylase-like protein